MHHPAFYIDNSLVIYKILKKKKVSLKNNKADPRKWIYTFFLVQYFLSITTDYPRHWSFQTQDFSYLFIPFPF